MNRTPDTPDVNQVSALPAELVARASTGLSETRLADGRVYWLERRPEESGRTTIMCSSAGIINELLPGGYNCRSRVHEYGGGSYHVNGENVFFIDDSDQQVYRLADGEVQRITQAQGCSFCDLIFDPVHQRLFAVCERCREGELPDNSIVSISLADGALTTIAAGHDFFASLRYDGSSRLAWLCWDFPDMPWDATELHVSTIDAQGRALDDHIITGGGHSIFQPEWHDGDLYYVSDASGWWNLYRFDGEAHQHLLPMQAEFGLPQWVFAQTTYAFRGGHLVASAGIQGRDTLVEIDLTDASHRNIDLAYDHLQYLAADEHRAVMIASSAVDMPCIIEIDADDRLHRIIDDPAPIDVSQISCAQALVLSSRSGADIHAFYYPPAVKPADGPPAMIVIGHGGPTGQSDASLDLRKQFWTSRGFAMLDVNYSGSTGYGRAYRERLHGLWGKLDVSDICDAALALCDMGRADPERLIIKGSSAGGFTVLAALTFEDVFRAGASYYGISDLETLARDTHKFEARYLDRLIGPYPEARDEYIARSPIHHAGQLDSPVIFLQGEEDRVVPRQQAETMLNTLKDKGIAVAYRLYPGEQHGFRQAQTIIDALESELCFYQRVFSLVEGDCGLEISNL